MKVDSYTMALLMLTESDPYFILAKKRQEQTRQEQTRQILTGFSPAQGKKKLSHKKRKMLNLKNKIS